MLIYEFENQYHNTGILNLKKIVKFVIWIWMTNFFLSNSTKIKFVEFDPVVINLSFFVEFDPVVENNKNDSFFVTNFPSDTICVAVKDG